MCFHCNFYVACRLKDAGDVVRLFHIIHPSSKSAAETKAQTVTDDHQLVSVCASLFSDTPAFCFYLYFAVLGHHKTPTGCGEVC